MRERGQSTVEYLGLVLVVAALLAAAGAAALALGRSSFSGREQRRPDAGADLVLARAHAPAIVFERGIRDAPVDPRACRAVACATGARPVLFAHVVHRGATTYVQYWAYWADSSWHGIAGRHADDWESYQVRVNPDGTVDARASAHHGYTGRRYGWDLNLSQVRPFARGWTRTTGWLRIGNRSHAGYLTSGPHGRRFTPAAEVRLVPIETAGLPEDYAISSPWRKVVYSDPESPRT